MIYTIAYTYTKAGIVYTNSSLTCMARDIENNKLIVMTKFSMAVFKSPTPVLLLILLLKLQANESSAYRHQINDRPIVGIMTQASTVKLTPFGTTYLPASYVKFIESAGARVVPILTNQSDSYYTEMFHSVNGVLWPGGALDDYLLKSQFGRIGKIFLELAIQSNKKGDYFPIWGTCQGMQLMASLAAGKLIMADLAAVMENKNVTFAEGHKESRLFGDAPTAVINALKTKAVTYNYHYFSVTPENFTRTPGLHSMYNILTTTKNDEGRVFISSMEAKDFPFYGVQFHPEKPLFEWTLKTNIKHDPVTNMVSQYLANFFVNEARKNSHRFSDVQEESDALIYSYNSTFTKGIAQLTQVYFFDP